MADEHDRSDREESHRDLTDLEIKAVRVRLPQELRERIAELVGQKQIADFIRAAIDSEIDRRTRLKRD